MRIDEISGTLSDQPLTRTQLSSIIKILDKKAGQGERKAAALKSKLIAQWKKQNGMVTSLHRELKSMNIDISKIVNRGITL